MGPTSKHLITQWLTSNHAKRKIKNTAKSSTLNPSMILSKCHCRKGSTDDWISTAEDWPRMLVESNMWLSIDPDLDRASFGGVPLTSWDLEYGMGPTYCVVRWAYFWLLL